MARVYVVDTVIATVTTAQTLIQIKAGATSPLELLRVYASFSAFAEVSDTAAFEILRKSAAATVTTYTPLLMDPDDPVAKAVGGTAATGTDATVEGTDTDTLHSEAVNTLAGMLWLPTPEERIIVPAAGFIGLKLNAAITSASIHCGIVFRELG